MHLKEKKKARYVKLKLRLHDEMLFFNFKCSYILFYLKMNNAIENNLLGCAKSLADTTIFCLNDDPLAQLRT